MDIYKEKSREFFDRADYLYSKFADIPHETDTVSALCINLKDYDNIRILNSSMHGLICEYYLKGMLLPVLDTIYETLDEYEPIRPILHSLNEEEKYNLLIGNTKETINNLSIENDKKKELIKTLKANTISSSSHNISKILKQIADNYEKIKDSVERELNDITEELRKIPDEEFFSDDYVENERLEILSDIDDFLSNIRSFDTFLEEPFKYSFCENIYEKYINLYEGIPKFEALLKILEIANINNAFPEARYGNLETNYDLDSDLLYEIMNTLQFESTMYDKCVILRNNNYLKRIYPDHNSKIYIIKDSKIERVYNYERIKDYFERISTDNYKDVLSHLDSSLSCTIEYGLDNILDKIPEPYRNYFDIISTRINIDNMNIICFYQNGELQIIYKKFFSDFENDNSDIKDIIDDYENNIKDNCLYEEQRKALEFLKEKNKVKETEKTLKKYLVN
ncbi:MAG: hypothetical protein IKE63_06645 [Bacilli bacterium]|nr:hypothetical protein [Bacilli bacterium]